MKKRIIQLIAIVVLAPAGVVAQKKWTLQECIDYAVTHNLTVLQAGTDIDIASANKSQSKVAMLPTGNGSVTNDYNIGFNINPLTNAYENQTVRSNSFSAGLTLVLFSGLQNLNSVKKANQLYMAAVRQKDAQKTTLTINVINAYLQLLYANNSVRVAENQLKLSTTQMQRVKESFDAGTASRAELADINALAATDEESKLQAQLTALTQQLSLMQYMNLQDTTGFDVEETDLTLASLEILQPSFNDLYQKTTHSYPAVLQAEANYAAAKYDWRIQKGNYYPTLSASGTLGTRYANNNFNTYSIINAAKPTVSIGVVEGTSQTVVTDNYTTVENGLVPFGTQLKDNMGYYIGLTLDIPISAYYTNINKVRNLRYTMKRYQQQVDIEKNNLFYSLKKARSEAQLTVQRFTAAKNSLKAQEEAFSYATDRFNIGQLSAYEYDQARNKYATAQLNEASAKYELLQRVKVLDMLYALSK